MTTSDRLAVFLRLVWRSKTAYGVTGLTALPLLYCLIPQVVDGKLLVNDQLFNFHFETAPIIATLSPLFGVLAMWGRAVAKGPLWPAIRPVVTTLAEAVEKAQAQQSKPAEPDAQALQATVWPGGPS